MHSSKKYRIVSATLALVLFSILGRAEDAPDTLAALKSMSLEDLGTLKINYVVAASKYEQKTTEAPASVSIVTQDEIKRYGYRTLAEILGSLQGFNVSYDRNYAYLGVRGFSLGDDNSRVLLLINGHRMNNNLTDSAFVGTEFLLDVDLIERVEVIRGPGSVLYGNNAFFGVINVITRKGGDVNGVEASSEYAGFDTYKVRFTAGKAFTNGVQFLLSGTYYQSDGQERLFYKEYNTPAQNKGLAENQDGDTLGSLFSSLSYKDFTLEGGFIDREKVNPTAQNFTTFDDSRARTDNQRSYADLKYAHNFPDFADVSARVYYDRTEIKQDYPFSVSPGGDPLYEEISVGECWGAELQLNKKLWDKHTISVGAEFRDDFRQDDRVFDNSGNTFLDLHTSRQNHGVFAEGDFELLKELHFDSGVRYDQYGDFDPFFSPRLALIYTPLEKSTFKAIYGTAFRAPNFQELLTPTIQPEQIKSYELVYEQGIGQHLRSSLAGYYNELGDLIVYRNGGYMNVDADSEGIELALEGNWAHDIRCRASYTLQKTRDRSGGGDFPDSPENMFKFNVSVPLIAEKLLAGLEFNYVSRRHTDFTDPSNAATVPGMDAPGYSVVNFTLFSKNIVKNLEVSASIYNLLNQSFSDPATGGHLQDQIQQDGRSFRIKATYRF